MKKILCITAILAILALLVPAASLISMAESEGTAPVAAPAAPAETMAIPDSALLIVGEVADYLALAYATHNYDGLDDYLLQKEQQLLAAIGATDKNDVKCMAHFDVANQTAYGKVMIRPDCLDKKLEVQSNFHLNDEGQRVLDVKIKGDLTVQQKAYAQLWVMKIKAQVPGILINVKYL